MGAITRVTVYSNDGGMDSDGHAFTASFHVSQQVIDYLTPPYRKPVRAANRMPCFEDLFMMTLKQFHHLRHHTETRQFAFRSQAEFDAWRRTVDFTDEDVKWSVKFEFYSGKIHLYIGFYTASTPVPMDELEQIIRCALDIA